MSHEDPLSARNLGAHVVKLLILLVGGCVIEAIKHAWEHPLITSAALNVGELAVFVYMVGSLGQAFRWSWNQWTLGKPIFANKGTDLLKQFLPKRVNLRNAFRLPRILRQLIILVIVLIVALTVFELVSDYRTTRDTQLLASDEEGVTLSPETTHYAFARLSRPGLTEPVILLFNLYSPKILLGIAIFSIIAFSCAALVVILHRQKVS